MRVCWAPAKGLLVHEGWNVALLERSVLGLERTNLASQLWHVHVERTKSNASALRWPSVVLTSMHT